MLTFALSHLSDVVKLYGCVLPPNGSEESEVGIV